MRHDRGQLETHKRGWVSPSVYNAHQHPQEYTGPAVLSLPSSSPHIPKAEARVMTSRTWKMSKLGFRCHTASPGQDWTQNAGFLPAASVTPKS